MLLKAHKHSVKRLSSRPDMDRMWRKEMEQAESFE